MVASVYRIMDVLLGKYSYEVLGDMVHGDLGLIKIEAVNKVHIDSHVFVRLKLRDQHLIN